MNKTVLSSLSFKRALLFLFLLPSYFLIAQEKVEKEDKPSYYYEVLGQGKIGFLVPSAYGDSFIADGYDTWNGIHIEAQARVKGRWMAGLQYQVFKGRVTNQELVGPIEASSLTHFFITGGYSLLEGKRDFQIQANMGLGWATLRNERGFQRFNDRGFALMAGVDFSYRLNYWLGFYINLQNNWDFWSIERPSELDDVFGTTSVFTPSVGLKFYIL